MAARLRKVGLAMAPCGSTLSSLNESKRYEWAVRLEKEDSSNLLSALLLEELVDSSNRLSALALEEQEVD